MKAAVLTANDEIRYEELPVPELGDGDVLVKMRAAGICGSDVPRVLAHGAHFYPIVLGHEFSGEVVSAGKNVKSLRPGDRVAGVPLVPCQTCEDCAAGNYSLCKKYSFIGSREQGAFAEFVKLPERNAVKFSDSVSFETAAFFEPSTVALHGILCNGYVPGGNVAVLGGGTIGMFTAQWARILGAKSVTVFDISEARLKLAESLGARAVDSGKPGFEEIVKAETNGRGYDYVFETAGQNATMRTAFRLAGNQAKVCFIGTTTKEVVFGPGEFELMNRKEFRLTGSWMSYSAPFPGKEWSMTAEYFSTGELRILPDFIYRKFPLSKAQEAFDLFKEPQNVKGKVLFEA